MLFLVLWGLGAQTLFRIPGYFLITAPAWRPQESARCEAQLGNKTLPAFAFLRLLQGSLTITIQTTDRNTSLKPSGRSVKGTCVICLQMGHHRRFSLHLNNSISELREAGEFAEKVKMMIAGGKCVTEANLSALWCVPCDRYTERCQVIIVLMMFQCPWNYVKLLFSSNFQHEVEVRPSPVGHYFYCKLPQFFCYFSIKVSLSRSEGWRKFGRACWSSVLLFFNWRIWMGRLLDEFGKIKNIIESLLGLKLF